MLIERIDDRVYLKSELLAKSGILHAFTTASGGISCGKVSGLNLGFRCGDNPKSVMKNYKLVAEDIGIPFERITVARQTHSVNIRIITETDAGKGVSRESDITETDGLVTNCRRIPIGIFYADCVPILLADEEAGVVAAVHSGWRGTAEKISKNAVEIMKGRFGSKPENIKAAIGPSIGPCCFECGAETAERFNNSLVRRTDGGKFKVDLWKANRSILEDCGVKSENIDVFEKCTMCSGEGFYSYRRQKEATGRMAAFIALEAENKHKQEKDG